MQLSQPAIELLPDMRRHFSCVIREGAALIDPIVGVGCRVTGLKRMAQWADFQRLAIVPIGRKLIDRLNFSIAIDGSDHGCLCGSGDHSPNYTLRRN